MTFLLIANSLSSVLNFRFDLIKAIQAKGFTVHVAAPEQDAAMQAKLKEAGVVYHQVAMSRSGLNPFADLSTGWQLYRLMRKIKPHKVLGYTIKPVVYGSMAGFFAGVKGRYSLIAGLGYAFTEDGEKSFKRRLVNWVARFLYGLALNRCHRVFFQNPDDEALFRKLGVLKPSTLSTVVNGSGVNRNWFSETPLPDKPSFILVARLLYDKGIREYAMAAKALKVKHPEVQFYLVGGLDENPKSVTLQQLNDWQQAGLVKCLGYRTDIPQLFSKANIVSLPSFYGEGLPKVLIEAAACGRAVVTTDWPGCRDAITPNETGLLVPVKNSAALADAIQKLVEDKALRENMGAAGRKLAEEVFDVNKVVEQHMGIYFILLGDQGGVRAKRNIWQFKENARPVLSTWGLAA